jgi:peptidoglycan/LPS O-acetylase OafA/YrhL
MRLSLANLRRVTSGGEYVAEIDGLRFIAIASVLAYHIWMLTGIALNDWAVPKNRIFAVGWNMLAFGERGVPIFFAISGFILGIPFAKDRLLGAKPVSLKQYFFVESRGWSRLTS